jgi:hypothetical protein
MELVNKKDILPEQIEKSDRKLIKFNIPENHNSYETGNGEGCWGYIEEDRALEQYENDIGEYNVILLNNCWEYPTLTYGTVCHVEARRDKRPVVKWDWLQKVLK